MIFRLIQDIGENPANAVVIIIGMLGAILFGFAFHELAHAVVAYRLGDDTAARAGRLTLNPFAHLNPFGTIMILLIGFGFAFTPVNPWRLRPNPRIGSILVSIAGPLTNLMMALVFALPFRFGLLRLGTPLGDGFIEPIGAIVYICQQFIIWNSLLAVFNMLPIPPLDGFKVLTEIAPRDLGEQIRRIEPYGLGIMVSIFALSYFNIDVIGPVLFPAMQQIRALILGA